MHLRLPSMENSADISEPQVPLNEEKNHHNINFPSVYSGEHFKKAISPIVTESTDKIEFIDFSLIYWNLGF